MVTFAASLAGTSLQRTERDLTVPVLTYRSILPKELDAGLVRRWRELQERDEAFASPYFCPEFTQAVARVRRDVEVALIEADGAVVGFFPFQRAGYGIARPVGGPFSDYHGVIAQPDVQWRVDELMRSARLSVWAFDHLAGATQAFAEYVRRHATSPQISLANGFEQFEKHLKSTESDFLENTRRKARKIAREIGELRFEYHDPGALQQMIEWKSAQYRRSHPSGIDVVFVNPWATGLVHEIASVQQPGGFAGVCSSLYAGDRLIAVHMGMRSRTHWHYWLPSYDVELSKYSPGSILLLRMIETAQARGIQIIDLGKGDSTYKSRVMTGTYPLLEGAVELPSLMSMVRRTARAAELGASSLPMLSSVLNLPARVLRKIERDRRFS
jgi:CelD/BcsL family acetyltransferase involved in cellulose biosynthesis